MSYATTFWINLSHSHSNWNITTQSYIGSSLPKFRSYHWNITGTYAQVYAQGVYISIFKITLSTHFKEFLTIPFIPHPFKNIARCSVSVCFK